MRFYRLPAVAAIVFCLATGARANIILFTIDSCRVDRFGCYGYDGDTTPNIDRWSRSGTVFTQAYSTSAWTAPGLASIMTGLYPAAHGIDNRDRSGAARLETLVKIFKAKGYQVPNLNFFTFAPYYANFGLGPVERRYFGDEEGAALLNWLRENAGKADASPFFVWYHATFVHQPYRPPPEDLPAPREELEKSPGIRAVLNGAIVPLGSTEFKPADKPILDALYNAEMRRTDRLFGKMLQLLQERGLLDSTLIIVTADHGEELLDHGFVGHASTSLHAKLFEELVHIPLILSWPGSIPSGAIRPHPVSQIDILPTILRLLQIDPPPGVNGRDLFDPDPDRALYFESVAAGNQTPRDREKEWIRGIRKGRWKLIEPTGLFDLLTDPHETRDLSALEPKLVEALDADLQTTLDRNRNYAREQLQAVPAPGPKALIRECPRIYTPGNGETLQYDVHTGTLLFDWSGDMDTAYLIEYDLGTGDHHVAGTYEVLGNHQILGPFPRELWVDLKAWNPFRIRVSPKQDTPCWSDWVEFKF